jgi:hypothetical protein
MTFAGESARRSSSARCSSGQSQRSVSGKPSFLPSLDILVLRWLEQRAHRVGHLRVGEAQRSRRRRVRSFPLFDRVLHLKHLFLCQVVDICVEREGAAERLRLTVRSDLGWRPSLRRVALKGSRIDSGP